MEKKSLNNLSYDEWLITESLGTDVIEYTKEFIVYFMYRKKNGQFSFFYGTRNLEFVPLYDQPKGDLNLTRHLASMGVYSIYDFKKEDWRRIQISRVIRIFGVEDEIGNPIDF